MIFVLSLTLVGSISWWSRMNTGWSKFLKWSRFEDARSRNRMASSGWREIS